MARADLFQYDPTAPLDLEAISSDQRDGAVVEDITYASPKGGKVSAYLVSPAGAGSCAGLIFVHWGAGNREEFLGEALVLSGMGVVSLLIDAPPAPREMELAGWADLDIQLVVDIRRGIDLLVARPDVDPLRLGYVGHSLGARVGGVVAGVEWRIAAYVFMGGMTSMSDFYRDSQDPLIVAERQASPPDAWQRFIANYEPLDAALYVGQAAPARLLFQFAREDEYITHDAANHFVSVASDPKEVRWYDGGHSFNVAARLERVEWLAGQLGFGPLGETLREKLEDAPQPTAAGA